MSGRSTPRLTRRRVVLLCALSWLALIAVALATRDERGPAERPTSPAQQPAVPAAPKPPPAAPPIPPRGDPAEPVVDLVEWTDRRAVAVAAQRTCPLLGTGHLYRLPALEARLTPLLTSGALQALRQSFAHPLGESPPQAQPRVLIAALVLREDPQTGARLALCTLSLTARGSAAEHRLVELEFAPDQARVARWSVTGLAAPDALRR